MALNYAISMLLALICCVNFADLGSYQTCPQQFGRKLTVNLACWVIKPAYLRRFLVNTLHRREYQARRAGSVGDQAAGRGMI